jgi:hypothetical protein
VKKAIAEKLAQAKDRVENPEATKAVSGSEATQFKQGVSGNPAGGGRPRSPLPKAAASEVRRQLAEIHQERSNFERIVAAQIQIAKDWKAPNACSRAFDALMDRAFGKPLQTVDQNVTVASREEDLKFLLEELGLSTHGNSSKSVQ